MPMTHKVVHHRVGGWLPADHRKFESWLAKKIDKVEHKQLDGTAEPLHPVIQDFKDFIENDAIIYQGFHEMFTQVPTKPPYNNDPTGKPQVRDYILMLQLFDEIITTGPDYDNEAFAGFPINAILDWPMGTEAGFKMFTLPQVNEHFKNMLGVWVEHLTSEASRSVLTTEANGWFGGPASEAIPNFDQTYICEPDAPYKGFKSWDAFFTRLFRPGVRPVTLPDDDSVITSACESTVFKIATQVKEKDQFWIKGQPYSLFHMFDNDPAVSQFVGGTVYQAFLSATKYHRWHSPVNGKIVKTVNVPGTYYAESPTTGFESGEPDPAGANNSQAFITHMAARALVFIEANDPRIGLMCFIGVGMGEVSSCEITVEKGEKVRKGDQIGLFRFGGSTHCLVFRPETKVVFDPNCALGRDVLLNESIGTVEG